MRRAWPYQPHFKIIQSFLHFLADLAKILICCSEWAKKNNGSEWADFGSEVGLLGVGSQNYDFYEKNPRKNQ